jgi:hypothetical protein
MSNGQTFASRRRSQLFPPLGCDGHHKMVDLRLTKRRAAEPGGSFAHLKERMQEGIREHKERPMIRKTLFAIATVAAIGAAALIPTQASAGGGKGGGMGGGYHGHGHWGGGYGGIVVIGPSCWRWVRGLGRVYVCY